MAERFSRHDEWGQPMKRTARGFSLLVGAVVVYVVGALSGGPIWARWIAGTSPAAPVLPAQGGRPTTAIGIAGNDITRVYRSASDSIFTITALSKGTAQTGPQEDIGTGFLIDNRGDVATNDHVVNGMQTVTVTINNNMLVGKVIGTDSLDDLAIIKIPPPPDIRPLSLGSAKRLQPGDPVIAIGNPFQLTSSVTSGIISGLNRSMPSNSGREMTGLLQTDASLNPGNSGGPLIDAAGQVVGINTAIESPIQGSVGIGFAIPIDKLKSVLPRMLSGQQVEHPWIGIVGTNIDPAVQQQFQLPVSKGILVLQVVKGGPAALAHIRPDSGGTSNPKGDGDILIAANGQPLDNVAALTAFVSKYPIGTVIHITVLRHGRRVTVDVKLQNWAQ